MKCTVAQHRWLLISLLWGAVGCAPLDHPSPRIVDTDSDYTSPLDNLPAQSPSLSVRPPSRAWIPQVRNERAWQAIVIHHSATSTGNAAIFDRWHREENHWNGVGYNFVIGNGSNSGDGEVEVTYRWQQQTVGAHCRTPNNWANEHAIGICLVGDFSHQHPSAAQMESLVQLVRFLRQRYRIPAQAVYGHGTTPGARVTACPGQMFPWDELRRSM